MLCFSSFCPRGDFHGGMSTFFVTPSLQTFENIYVLRILSRKPCQNHTFDLLCFSNPNQNLNSRQRRKSFIAAKKEINCTFLLNTCKKKKLIWTLKSVLIGHLFRVCSRFVVVLVAQLKSRRSCVAYRLPVVVRFPAGPRVRLKCRRPAERQRARTKKRLHARVLAASVLLSTGSQRAFSWVFSGRLDACLCCRKR